MDLVTYISMSKTMDLVTYISMSKTMDLVSKSPTYPWVKPWSRPNTSGTSAWVSSRRTMQHPTPSPMLGLQLAPLAINLKCSSSLTRNKTTKAKTTQPRSQSIWNAPVQLQKTKTSSYAQAPFNGYTMQTLPFPPLSSSQLFTTMLLACTCFPCVWSTSKFSSYTPTYMHSNYTPTYMPVSYTHLTLPTRMVV